MGTMSWSPPHPPHPPPGEELMLHPSTGARGSSGLLSPVPLTAPTTALMPDSSSPADSRMLGSEALRLRTGD